MFQGNIIRIENPNEKDLYSTFPDIFISELYDIDGDRE